MNTIYSDHKGNSRIGQIDIFLEIAIDNYIAANKLHLEKKELLKRKKKIIDPSNGKEYEFPGFDNLRRLFFIQNKRFKHEIQGIISLVTFYEALINEIGITELGNEYFNTNLERKSIMDKWKTIPKLVYNDSIDKKARYYGTMFDIVKLRNKLVHYKTKLHTGQSDVTDFFRLLKLCLFNIHGLIADLKVLDKDKGIIYFADIDKKIKKIKTSR